MSAATGSVPSRISSWSLGRGIALASPRDGLIDRLSRLLRLFAVIVTCAPVSDEDVYGMGRRISGEGGGARRLGLRSRDEMVAT
jgi:hypothetical protein